MPNAVKQKNPAAFKYFGEVAQTYDAIRSKKRATKGDDYIIDKFLATCRRGSIVADIPAGTGRAVHAVLKHGLKYVGIDISEDMLQICRSKIGDHQEARLLQADACSLPLEDKEVDVILCVKLMKWFPTDEMVLDVLREFRRVCSGRMLVNIKTRREQSLLKSLARGILKQICQNTSHLQTSTRQMTPLLFENLCGVAGWTIDEMSENTAANHVRFYVLS